VTRVLLCTGVLLRDDDVLLTASRYPNHPEPLWGLPGGRPREGESLAEALAREWEEETGLRIEPGPLLYVSESFDRSGGVHVVNVTFAVQPRGAALAPPRVSGTDAHVVAVEWVPRDEIAARVDVRVVREPLVAYLSGDPRRYFALGDAGITVRFADEP
jgi:ADP-ribose pyrophosphatase YjhB (NUDIX family)